MTGRHALSPNTIHLDRHISETANKTRRMPNKKKLNEMVSNDDSALRHPYLR